MENPAVKGKKLAALKAIEYIRPGMTLGLGTGSTAYWAIQGIGDLVKEGMAVRAVAATKTASVLRRSSRGSSHHCCKPPSTTRPARKKATSSASRRMRRS